MSSQSHTTSPRRKPVILLADVSLHACPVALGSAHEVMLRQEDGTPGELSAAVMPSAVALHTPNGTQPRTAPAPTGQLGQSGQPSRSLARNTLAVHRGA